LEEKAMGENGEKEMATRYFTEGYKLILMSDDR
jgi:hypothetical protein